jgi:hypothetical protein
MRYFSTNRYAYNVLDISQLFEARCTFVCVSFTILSISKRYDELTMEALYIRHAEGPRTNDIILFGLWICSICVRSGSDRTVILNLE